MVGFPGEPTSSLQKHQEVLAGRPSSGFRMPPAALLEGTQKISVRPAKLLKAARPRGEADCDLRGSGGSHPTLWVIMTAGECRLSVPKCRVETLLEGDCVWFLVGNRVALANR